MVAIRDRIKGLRRVKGLPSRQVDYVMSDHHWKSSELDTALIRVFGAERSGVAERRSERPSESVRILCEPGEAPRRSKRQPSVSRTGAAAEGKPTTLHKPEQISPEAKPSVASLITGDSPAARSAPSMEPKSETMAHQS